MKFSLQFAKYFSQIQREKGKTEWELFIRNRKRLRLQALHVTRSSLKKDMYFGWLFNSYNNPKVKTQSSKLFATPYENWYNSFSVNFLNLNSRARFFLFFSAILFSIISINSITEFNGIFLVMCFIVSCASS